MHPGLAGSCGELSGIAERLRGQGLSLEWHMPRSLRLAPYVAVAEQARTRLALKVPGPEFPQVRPTAWSRGVAVCKTVGSAYVGSNPTPVTA
jgi:hypothetical protein